MIPLALFYCTINLVDLVPLVLEGTLLIGHGIRVLRIRPQRRVWREQLVYLMVALLPLLWIVAAAKPAYDHMYLQYRGLGVMLYAGILFLLGTAFPACRYAAAADGKRPELQTKFGANETTQDSLQSKEVFSLKTAIVHDWLVTYAGADRVVDQIHQTFPDAVIYTLVYDKSKFPAHFQAYDVRTTYLQKLPFSTKLYKNMLTLMPGAFERLNLTEYDLVISSSSCCSKGVITRPDAVHVCYCHTPTRYLWDFYYTYVNNSNWLKRKLIPSMIHKMRIWDRLAADRVDYFVANSKYIAQRITKYYRRDSAVIYPCVHINEHTIEQQPNDYYLLVSRFTYYKRIDLAVVACTKLGKRLVNIGGGEEEKKLRAIAGPTIEFLGKRSDEEVKRAYSHAKAFLFPGEEDFGITPVEAMSAGCPVLAYGKGGVTETVLAEKTGMFFGEQTVDSLVECIRRFEQKGVSYSREQIRAHSLQFSEERFREEIRAFCEAAMRGEGKN